MKETSKIAFREAVDNGYVTGQRRQIVMALRGRRPLTVHEIAATDATTISEARARAHSYGRRMSELVRAGFVVECEPRGCAITNRKTTTYSLPDPEALVEPAELDARPAKTTGKGAHACGAQFTHRLVAKHFPLAPFDASNAAAADNGDRLFVHARLPTNMVRRIDSMGTRTNVVTALVAMAFQAIDNAEKVRAATGLRNLEAVDDLLRREAE